MWPVDCRRVRRPQHHTHPHRHQRMPIFRPILVPNRKLASPAIRDAIVSAQIVAAHRVSLNGRTNQAHGMDNSMKMVRPVVHKTFT